MCLSARAVSSARLKSHRTPGCHVPLDCAWLASVMIVKSSPTARRTSSIVNANVCDSRPDLGQQRCRRAKVRQGDGAQAGEKLSALHGAES